MREIKFRAWDAEEKVMWQPLTLDQIIRADWEFETDPYEYTLPWKDYVWSQHHKTVWMQYTGLKDKNGKEIYEGDIVSTPDEQLNVEWIENGWWFRNKSIDQRAKMNDALSFEIIGNIYENPDLCK